MATKKNIVTLNKDADITDQLEVLRADIALLAQSVKTQAKAKVADKAGTAIETATEKAEVAKARYDEMSSRAETSIKENPLTAVAIAVGAGMLLGALTRR